MRTGCHRFTLTVHLIFVVAIINAYICALYWQITRIGYRAEEPFFFAVEQFDGSSYSFSYSIDIRGLTPTQEIS